MTTIVTDVLLKQISNTVSIEDSISVRKKGYYPTFDEAVGMSVGGVVSSLHILSMKKLCYLKH